MKTNLQSPIRVARKLGGLLGAVALILSARNISLAAPSADPSGGGSQTWDCIMSGKNVEGIAFLTFGNDGSLTGSHIFVPKQKTSSTNSSGRTVGDDGRGGDVGGGTNSSPIGCFDVLNRQWRIDLAGH